MDTSILLAASFVVSEALRLLTAQAENPQMTIGEAVFQENPSNRIRTAFSELPVVGSRAAFITVPLKHDDQPGELVQDFLENRRALSEGGRVFGVEFVLVVAELDVRRYFSKAALHPIGC